MPRIPIFEDLTAGPIPPGSNLLVVFDPASDWYNASLTIAVGWLKSGGRVHYNTSMLAPNVVRSKLKQLGLDADSLEKEDTMRIYDWYTMTLGGKSTDKDPLPSLKVQDMSPRYGTWMKSGGLNEDATTLRLIDNDSTLARFNDERSWIEFLLSRVFPRSSLSKATRVSPVVRGLHSDWVYKALEAAADAIIDFKLDETQDPTCNLVRIRNIRNVRFDGTWHRLKIDEKFLVTLKQ